MVVLCSFLSADLRTMILEKETELAKINKELKDLEHYKVGFYLVGNRYAVNTPESYGPALVCFLLFF